MSRQNFSEKTTYFKLLGLFCRHYSTQKEAENHIRIWNELEQQACDTCIIMARFGGRAKEQGILF